MRLRIEYIFFILSIKSNSVAEILSMKSGHLGVRVIKIGLKGPNYK